MTDIVRQALEGLLAVRKSITPGSKLDPDAVQDAWAAAERALAASAAQPGGPARTEITDRIRVLKHGDQGWGVLNEDCEEAGIYPTWQQAVRFAVQEAILEHELAKPGVSGGEAQDIVPMQNDLFAQRTEDFGVIRVSRWPKGLVVWVGGEIRWKSWKHPATTTAASGQAVAQEPVAWIATHVETGKTGKLAAFKNGSKPDDHLRECGYEPVWKHTAPSAASVRAEALEEAARVCELSAETLAQAGCDEATVIAVGNLASAIRALQTPRASGEAT